MDPASSLRSVRMTALSEMHPVCSLADFTLPFDALGRQDFPAFHAI
jgi:hypothetical protein